MIYIVVNGNGMPVVVRQGRERAEEECATLHAVGTCPPYRVRAARYEQDTDLDREQDWDQSWPQTV